MALSEREQTPNARLQLSHTIGWNALDNQRQTAKRVAFLISIGL